MEANDSLNVIVDAMRCRTRAAVRLAGLVIGTSLVVAACGTTNSDTVTTPQAETPTSSDSCLESAPVGEPVGDDIVERAEWFGSIEELASRSPLIAYVAATEKVEVAPINNTPFAVRTVTVTRILKGAADDGAALQVQQLGGPNASGALQADRNYLIFAEPYEIVRGEPTGRWSIVGLYAGLWAVHDDRAVRIDSESTCLPGGISIDDMESRIRSVLDG